MAGSRTAKPHSSAALKYAKTAIGIAPDLPEQHWVVGYVNTQQRKYDEGRAALQKAIDIDPGFADAYALSGGIETYRGNPAETVPLLRKAIRLNPHAGYLYFLLLAAPTISSAISSRRRSI